ncbi:MAG: P-loop NTPase family protein [Planctomycetota bacterium]|jgi:Mrp family chromosome partitioning ATPase
MPGLGSAFGRAFEDSSQDLENLVDRAARGEELAEETEPAAEADPQAETEPVAEASPGGLSPGERADLVDGEEPTEAAPAGAASGKHKKGKTTVMGLELDDDQSTVLEEETGPADPIPAPEEDGEALALGAEEEAGGVEAQLEAAFAPFGPSGVIRRTLGKKKKPGAPGDGLDLPPEQVPATALEISLPDDEDALTASMPIDPGDIVGGCRRVGSLEGCADLRIPLLLDGIGGLLRMLRTGSTARPGMVAICGACPQAGTSTVAAAAALSLAEEKSRKVLLVDADFRAPSVSRMAGRNASGPDFRSVLKGEVPAVDAVLYAPSENLAVLPVYGGGLSEEDLADSVSLLSAERLSPFLAAVREQFDHVIVDAGSVAEWAGPATAAGVVGSTVLVVRAGAVSSRAAAAAKAVLTDAGAHLAGAVLTFAEGA